MPVEKVRIATCRDSAEAAMVRSLLAAHDIHAVVTGEHHVALLGPIAGGFIGLDVMVDRQDAARATELIRELREGVEGLDDAALEAEALAAGDEPVDPEAPVVEPVIPVAQVIERRKRTALAVLLALTPSFGFAHLFARAWMRGISLAAIELVGLAQAVEHPPLGAAMVAGAVAADLVGGVYLARKPRPGEQGALPVATLRR